MFLTHRLCTTQQNHESGEWHLCNFPSFETSPWQIALQWKSITEPKSFNWRIPICCNRFTEPANHWLMTIAQLVTQTTTLASPKISWTHKLHVCRFNNTASALHSKQKMTLHGTSWKTTIAQLRRTTIQLASWQPLHNTFNTATRCPGKMVSRRMYLIIL